MAVLPNVPGLDFWESATGGTQLTPDVNGNVIDRRCRPGRTVEPSSRRLIQRLPGHRRGAVWLRVPLALKTQEPTCRFSMV